MKYAGIARKLNKYLVWNAYKRWELENGIVEGTDNHPHFNAVVGAPVVASNQNVVKEDEKKKEKISSTEEEMRAAINTDL